MFAHLAELPVAEAPRVSPARIRSAHWQTAVTVLDKIWDGRQAADAALQAWFRDHRQMGGRDRANVTMLVYGVLRDAMRLRRLAVDAAPAALLLVMHALLAGPLVRTEELRGGRGFGRTGSYGGAPDTKKQY